MALDWNNVQKAWKILHAVNPAACNSFINEHDEENPFIEDNIMGCGKKSDDGWENVFLNIKNITPTQLALFNERKNEVDNSSFIRDVPADYWGKYPAFTRIGWF